MLLLISQKFASTHTVLYSDVQIPELLSFSLKSEYQYVSIVSDGVHKDVKSVFIRMHP